VLVVRESQARRRSPMNPTSGWSGALLGTDRPPLQKSRTARYGIHAVDVANFGHRRLRPRLRRYSALPGCIAA